MDIKDSTQGPSIGWQCLNQQYHLQRCRQNARRQQSLINDGFSLKISYLYMKYKL
jgi:hypothetical protein